MLRKRMEGEYKGSPSLDLATSDDNFSIMYRDVEQDLTTGLLMREAASGGKTGLTRLRRGLNYIGEWKADPAVMTSRSRMEKLRRYELVSNNIGLLKGLVASASRRLIPRLICSQEN